MGIMRPTKRGETGYDQNAMVCCDPDRPVLPEAEIDDDAGGCVYVGWECIVCGATYGQYLGRPTPGMALSVETLRRELERRS